MPDVFVGEKDETDFKRSLHIFLLATFQVEPSDFQGLHREIQRLIKPEIDTVRSFYKTKLS